jgi:cell division protein FtsX
VNLYFVTHAAHAQEKVVGAKLRQDPRVGTVVFVSKAQALAEMEKNLGKLPKTFTYPNPLPDAFTVMPVLRSDTGQLEASVAHSHWPGVAKVTVKLCRK